MMFILRLRIAVMEAPTNHHARTHLELDVNGISRAAGDDENVAWFIRRIVEPDFLEEVTVGQQIGNEVPCSGLYEELAIRITGIADRRRSPVAWPSDSATPFSATEDIKLMPDNGERSGATKLGTLDRGHLRARKNTVTTLNESYDTYFGPVKSIA